MVDAIMYEADGYVVLRHDQPEQLMEAAEIRAYFEQLLTTQPELLPTELASLSSLTEQIEKLLDDYCELEIPDGYLQWYVVRFEK